MLDLFLKFAESPRDATDELRAALASLLASAGGGDRQLVEQAEHDVRAAPRDAFAFDADGFATLHAAGHTFHAGRFETPTVAELRSRLSGSGGRLRLWVLDGAHAATDVGGLQATAPERSLFQAASQFNCLESPGPYVTPVTSYFRDYTQGPRASISAFPATLLRHYSAPGPHGRRFVQTDAKQLNLLADVFGPDVARVQSGYLTSDNVRDAEQLVASLTVNFESIRVGLHEAAQVVLGYDFEGGVEDSETRRIAQVFTSTVAAGGYGGGGPLSGSLFEAACRQLLRGAYLGTLLSAAVLRQRYAVLTLIGGGVFGNPVPLIWDAILWAADEVAPHLADDLDVIVNGRNLGQHVSRDAIISATRPRGGALLAFDRWEPLPAVIR